MRIGSDTIVILYSDPNVSLTVDVSTETTVFLNTR